MRPLSRVVWISLAAVGTLALGWSMWSLLKTPISPAKAARSMNNAPPAAAATTGGVPTVNSQGYWNDPSIDPQVLKRAYPPPPKDLPEEAKPQPLQLKPTAQQWHDLQDQGLVAY